MRTFQIRTLAITVLMSFALPVFAGEQIADFDVSQGGLPENKVRFNRLWEAFRKQYEPAPTGGFALRALPPGAERLSLKVTTAANRISLIGYPTFSGKEQGDRQILVRLQKVRRVADGDVVALVVAKSKRTTEVSPGYIYAGDTLDTWVELPANDARPFPDTQGNRNSFMAALKGGASYIVEIPEKSACPFCAGRGKLKVEDKRYVMGRDEPCKECSGKGSVETSCQVRLMIPATAS